MTAFPESSPKSIENCISLPLFPVDLSRFLIFGMSEINNPEPRGCTKFVAMTLFVSELSKMRDVRPSPGQGDSISPCRSSEGLPGHIWPPPVRTISCRKQIEGREGWRESLDIAAGVNHFNCNAASPARNNYQGSQFCVCVSAPRRSCAPSFMSFRTKSSPQTASGGVIGTARSGVSGAASRAE